MSVLLADGTTQPTTFTEIVISIDSWNADIGHGTIFDLARSVVLGRESRIAYEVRNALRRYGIRFEPYAWRADFRKGL
jgi:hypothetical protein